MTGGLNNRTSRRLFAAIAALLSLGAVSAALRDAPSASAQPGENAPSALPVALVPLHAEADYAVRRLHAGRIVSRRQSELGFERSGLLVEVTRDQGDRVEAGSVLARLDTRALRARRRELLAQRDRISAELTLARATTARREQLFETGVVSTQRFDESVYAQESLESQLVAANASIEHLDVQLELSELRAPFAGILSERHADEGTVLQPGAPVLRLIEDAAPEVHVGMPPDAAGRLEVGGVHVIEVEGETAEARLHTVLPTVDAETRTVTAVFHLAGAVPAAARHGALARIAVERKVAADGFWVPLEALAEGRRGLWTAYVAVPEADGLTAERRQVEVIHAEADRAYVRGTLFDGDLLVAAGAHRIVPGMRVRIASEG